MQNHTHPFSYAGPIAAYQPLGSGNQSCYRDTINSVTGGVNSGRVTTENVTRGKRKGAKYIIKVL